LKKLTLNYSPYTLKFKHPFITSEKTVTERKGFFITLIDETGQAGIGEAAPFPEFGSETFDEVNNFLENFKLNLKIDLNNIYKSFDDNLGSLNKLPALRHGIEQALLNLICSENKTSMNNLLNVTSIKEINVNAVIGFLSIEDIPKKINELIEQGFSTIKMKVGRDNFEEDIESISLVRKSVNTNIKLRIDANGKWTLNNAKRNLKKLEKFNIEYVEQPVKNINDFIELSKIISIPLAADESLRTFNDAVNIIKSKAAHVLVIKPMMLGGIITVIKIIELAKMNNLKITITSSFESGIGKSMAVFAASIIEDETAHGLATSDFFENYISNDPYPVTHGKIILSKN